MALVLKDRVKETSTTAGTGTITLAGAVAGFQSFSAVGNGNTTYYAIVDNTTGDWEVGIGTYTASGTTLSRTTVLSSSNSGSLVSFTSNPKDVFVTYPSEKSVYEDASNVVNATSFGAITATSAALTTGTVSTTPAANTDIANKQYVDGLVTQGISYHEPVFVESPNTVGNLNATYNNGASGVGATLTNAGTQVALTVDGVLMTVGKRVLIYNQTAQAQNGVYTVTTVGTGSTNWVLTRATDANTYGLRDPNALGYNDAFFVTNGDTGAGETYVCTTTGTITFGTTAITFAQISSAQVYTAGTGLNLSPATTFNISNTGVTATTYGSASAVPVVTFNAQGQATGVTNTTIAIAGSQVSGNISGSSGSVANALTLGTYLTGGSFNGSAAVTATVDATSANTASKVVARDSSGNFSAGTITATLSGSSTSATTATNIAGGAANQIPYQTGSGATSFITAASGTNTVLNFNGSAFSWSTGTISGVPLGSNLNSLTAGTYLTGTAYNGSAAQTWTVDATSANTASKVVARDASGNFSAGTITAALSGNATSATNSTTTSQTNFSNLTIGSSQVLYAGNYNSYAPTLTGTGASGTWNINITGNAATATSATTAGSATTATTSTYSTYLSSVGNYVWNNATASTSYYNGISNAFVSSAEGFPNYGDVMTMNSYSGGGGALQLYSPYGSAYPDLNLRFRTADYSAGGAWTAWKVILDAANYNSYAPTLTGTGASGTWGISITGSAGSAGSVDFANLTNKTGGTGTYTTSGDYRAPIFYDYDNTAYYGNFAGTSNFDRIAVVRSGDNVYTDANYGYGLVGAYSSTRFQGVFAMGDSYKLPADGTTTGNLYGIAWSYPSAGGAAANLASHGMLILQNGVFQGAWGGGSLRTPGDVRGTLFYDWDNTGYYVDPNGTSNLAGSITIGGRTVYTTAAIYDNASSGNDIGIAFGSGIIYPTNGTGALINNSKALGNVSYTFSNLYLGSAAYAPIYYDYNDTGFYVDPAATSSQKNILIGYNSASPYVYDVASTGVITFGTTSDTPNYSIQTALESYNGYYSKLRLKWYTGIQHYASNYYGGHRFYDISGTEYFGIGVGSGANWSYSNYSHRAPIFYDLDNTGYYVDPAGFSNMGSLTLNGSAYFRPNNWIELDGNYGIYNSVYNGAHFYANTTATYGTWTIIGSKNSYSGVYDTYSGVNASMYDSSGNGGIYREANGRWYQYYLLSNDCTGFGTSTTNAAYNIYCPKGVYSGGRVDGTIFYDTNNTGYYLDMNGSSNMSTTVTGNMYFVSNFNTASGSSAPLQAYSSGGSGAVMSFHRGGYYAVNFGLDSDNVMRLGGWSASANLLQIDMSGNLTMLANVTAYSDERLKKNWDDLPSDFVPRLARVKSGTYTRIDNEMRQIGVGAQSLRPLMEEAVFENADGTLSVAYGNAAMASSVELARYVTALEQRISQLEARI